jgi:hypothetical protein
MMPSSNEQDQITSTLTDDSEDPPLVVLVLDWKQKARSFAFTATLQSRSYRTIMILENQDDKPAKDAHVCRIMPTPPPTPPTNETQD